MSKTIKVKTYDGVDQFIRKNASRYYGVIRIKIMSEVGRGNWWRSSTTRAGIEILSVGSDGLYLCWLATSLEERFGIVIERGPDENYAKVFGEEELT